MQRLSKKSNFGQGKTKTEKCAFWKLGKVFLLRSNKKLNISMQIKTLTI